ncbi:MAG: hypothetical protein IPP13_18380 [Kouleothrix sp.]|jgi:hypothetical protein|nr:hypothetical protein [Kouleothrix sp.]
MPILADVAIGPMILLGGLLAGLALFIPIVLLEALVLWAMRWAGFKRALRDSAIVNGVSTILGLVFFAAYYATSWRCERIESADGLQVVENCDFAISPLVWLAIAGLLSIVIEGLVLLWLRKYPPRITWDAVIAANVASYALLAVLMVLGLLKFG